jgi:GTPase SAR1 family protein
VDSTTEKLSYVLTKALEILEPLRATPRLYEELQVLLAESACARLRIGVVGVTSSGKSTFINGLLGESLLPEDSIATTNIPVICRNGARRKVIVFYEATAEGIPEPVEYHDDAVTADLLRSLSSEEGNPGNERGISRVEVESPACCLPPTLEIIDTPGTDAQGLPNHEAATLYRCLPLADIVVFMTNIQRRIQESEARLLRSVIDHDQRVLFVMARSDTEKDEEENGEIILTKKQKLRNREKGVAATLAGFENLRYCLIFSVSSVLAKAAHGDRSTRAWLDSNFDSVVACFDEYAKDLEELLASSRIERTRAIVESVSKRIKSQTAELAEAFEKTTAAAHQVADRSASIEREMRAEVEDVRQEIVEAFDAAALRLEAAAELAGVSESDPAGISHAMERLGKRWKRRTAAQQAKIDELREKLRTDLAELKLETGRSQLQQKALRLDPLPDASARIKPKTRSYEVTVPRTYWGGSLIDDIFGKRTETLYETTSVVDLAALKRDLTSFVTRSAQQFQGFAVEQCELLLDLYVHPVTREKRRDAKRFRELADRPDLTELLPEMVRRLKELHEEHFPAKEFPRRAGPVRRQDVTVVGEGDADAGADDRKKTVRNPLNVVLARLWESRAIQRFIDAANQAATSGRLREVLLLGPPDNVRDLAAFLTRSLRSGAGGANSSKTEVSDSRMIVRPSGRTRISWFCEDQPPASLVLEACESADAIAVCFEAGQPSLGIGLLLGAGYFECLENLSHKVFYVYGDGAVFDTRLADLVTQVAPLVARETRFGPRPWYIYQAATYDARYSDFLELSAELTRSGGSDRDFVRHWRQARLSMRDPFREEVLASAFAAAAIEESRRAKWQITTGTM